MLKGLFANLNLAQKLSISFLTLALIPIVIVTAIASYNMYNERMATVNQHNLYVARMKSDNIKNILMNQIQLMEALSASLEAKSMNPAQMIPLLQNGVRHSPLIGNMFICDLTGQQVARVSGNYVNVADRDYVRAVMQEGKAYAFSDAVISKATNRVMIIAAVPIKDEAGNVVGAMASTFNMDTLQKLLLEDTNNLTDRQEIVFLTDSKGNVMIHPEEKFMQTLTNWSSMEPVKAAASGKTEVCQYVNGDNVDSLAASASVGNLGWGIVVENSRSDVMSVIYNAITTIAIIMIVLLALVVVFARILANSFATPMKELAEKSELMANGDLTVRLNVESNDEIGHAANAFNKMSCQMNEVMSKISIASQQVASGSKNIADAGNMLAKGASSQASSVEELSASISEINEQTKNNAGNAEEANNLASDTHTKANIGNQRMEEMLQAMVDINESSNNIAKIIKVIDEIAFQTNILALNAAVEAARAGQHGKGFAVVAEEVRNLAARSAEAAKSTTEIIQHSIDKVNAGTELAKGTAQALHSIKESIDQVTVLVADIAQASQKQSSALQMLNQGVLQVSNVVQTNSSTAEESASASVELNAQAELLQEAVSKFKI